MSAIKNKKKPPVFALLRASFFLSTWTCYFFSPTGIIAYADQEINMQVILKHSETNKKLLFTHHCPARCFGMNMPKSRDIQAKIPLPQAIWNLGYVTVNGVNSNIGADKIKKNMRKYRKKAWIYEV